MSAALEQIGASHGRLTDERLPDSFLEPDRLPAGHVFAVSKRAIPLRAGRCTDRFPRRYQRPAAALPRMGDCEIAGLPVADLIHPEGALFSSG